MDEYITKAEAIKALETDCHKNRLTGQRKLTVYSAISRIKSVKPVADVVPVVRCKDCRKSRISKDGRYCILLEHSGYDCTVSNDDFCSFAWPVEKPVESVDNLGGNNNGKAD